MASSNPAIYITGSGVVCCAGETPQALWSQASENQSGISNGIGRVAPHPELPNSTLSFSISAIDQALHRAGWTHLNDDDGIILATTTGQIPIWDKSLIAFLNGELSRQDFERVFAHQPIGTLLDAISAHYHFYGRSFLVATACTASTQAIALASQWIQLGRVKRCLVVGAEVLCTLTLEGFKCLQLRSPTPSKPFDMDRKGINLAEGAAALCLESGEAAKYHALARIAGVGMATDSFHMTAPEPEGRGCKEAIAVALNSSGLTLKDISWIHAHGTGSLHNDLAEGAALCNLFKEAMPPVTSTKSIHGHSLGASGAIETVLCLEALIRQQIIKTAGLEKPDPAIPIHHTSANGPAYLKHILKLTLGFGGTNAALILSRPDAEAEHGS